MAGFSGLMMPCENTLRFVFFAVCLVLVLPQTARAGCSMVEDQEAVAPGPAPGPASAPAPAAAAPAPAEPPIPFPEMVAQVRQGVGDLVEQGTHLLAAQKRKMDCIEHRLEKPLAPLLKAREIRAAYQKAVGKFVKDSRTNLGELEASLEPPVLPESGAPAPAPAVLLEARVSKMTRSLRGPTAAVAEASG